MDILNESERRFTKKLCDAMIPAMIEAFWEIWLEAKKESQGKNTPRVFQELLRGVELFNFTQKYRDDSQEPAPLS